MNIEEQLARIKELGAIVNGGHTVEAGSHIEYYPGSESGDAHLSVVEETVTDYTFEYDRSGKERRRAKRYLKKYLKASDFSLRSLAKQEFGPTKFESLAETIYEYPFLTAVVFGLPIILGVIKFWQYTETLLK